MKGRKAVIMILMIFVIIMIGASVFYRILSDGKTGKTSDSGETSAAADFTVQDRDENKVSLSDMKGEPVVINFWASWCGPCKSEMPAFEDAYDEYGEKVKFMMVNLTGGSETVESAEEFIASGGYSFPVYFDIEGQAASAYDIYSIPATYFIDEDGNIAGYVKGALDENSLKEGIELIYNKKP